VEPLLVTQWYEEMNVRMFRFDLHDCGVVHVVVVIVRDDDRIDFRDLFDLAGHLCKPLWAKPAERAASFTEDWVEEYTQASREFYIITSMT